MESLKISHNYEAIWRHVERLPWTALVATGRVGSDFFQSLLDGHPEIFVFNGQISIHEWWIASRFTQFDGPLDIDDLLYDFLGVHLIKFRSRYDHFERKGILGENQCESINIDLDEFRKHVRFLIGNRIIDSRTFSIAVYTAYDLCIGRDVLSKKIFFHHIHRIHNLDPYLEDFPDSKIICMTRDPRAAYVSGVEHWRRYNASADNSAYPLYVFYRIIEEARPLLSFGAERVRALRLEDLGDRDVLKAVCLWLDVDYNLCLQKSTWAGLRWWGDTLSEKSLQRRITDFPRIWLSITGKKLRWLDVYVMDYILADRLIWFGYPSRHSYGIFAKFIIPFLILLPTTYERRYLSPKNLVQKLLRFQIKDFVRAFYHPLRRMVVFFKMYTRTMVKPEPWLLQVNVSPKHREKIE